MVDEKDLEKVKRYLAESDNVVFFGGAGVSTDSGIPDFRSKDGLYNQHDVQFERYSPEYLLSADCLHHDPEVFFEFYRQKLDTRKIQPNITHRALAKMEADGKLKAIVTQNIDGLHQKAGSRNVLEIHGTTERNYCERCRKPYPADYLFESRERVPRCTCGGMIRPEVTLYGEGLPEEAVRRSIAAISQADCLIVGGTSLSVYPAASYIRYFRGKHLIVINKEPIQVQLNPDSDVAVIGSLSEVFMRFFRHREIEKPQ